MKIDVIDKKESNQSNKFYSFITVIFCISCFFFFIQFVFLNEKGRMLFPEYIPATKTIGGDLSTILKFTSRYFIDNQSAYIGDNPNKWFIGNGYPPLFTFFMGPFVYFNFSHRVAYFITVALILFSFLWISMLLPMIFLKDSRFSPLLMFIVTTGFISYGMQFALERGQFDLIAMAFCMTSIYLFWFKPKMRWLAYIMLIISFEFKMYPIIFLATMVDGLKKWKATLIRIAGITLAILASLFVMGFSGMKEFIRALTAQVASGAYPKDHGFNTGIDFLVKVVFPDLSTNFVSGIKLGVIFLGLTAFLVVFWIYLKRYPEGGFSPPLIFACMLVAMVLFPASKDYKLALLSGVFGIYLIYMEKKLLIMQKHQKVSLYVLTGFLIFGYTTTLFSYMYRPVLLQNSFPVLFLMLLGITLTELILAINDKVSLGLKSNYSG